MKMHTFVRRPFTVKAVEVTRQNIHELAPYIGTVETSDRGQEFIQVDKSKVPNIGRVWPGHFVTVMGGNIRCFTRKSFIAQFAGASPDIMTWVEWMEAEAPCDIHEHTGEEIDLSGLQPAGRPASLPVASPKSEILGGPLPSEPEKPFFEQVDEVKDILTEANSGIESEAQNSEFVGVSEDAVVPDELQTPLADAGIE